MMVLGAIIPSVAMARPVEVEKLSTNGLEIKDNQVRTYIVEIYDEQNRTRNSVSTYAERRNDQQTVSEFKAARSMGQETSVIAERINDQNNVLAEIFGQRQISRNFDSLSYSHLADRKALKTSAFRSFGKRPIINDISQLKDMPRYKAILNGFALKMTQKQAEEVAKLDGVKAVTLAREYEKPSMLTSREMVKSSEANKKGYDGQGRVVAILDTGADVNHPDLRISNPDKAKYNEDSINEVIEKNQLWGTYRTEKIPYAYNYADRSQDIKDSANHGQHIAGTIAGNSLKEDGTRGIVPEAQLLVMRVFALNVPTTNSAIYAEAVDDAVILGADSINMSLGSFAGSVEDADAIMDHVVENANNAGSLVAIAAGNDGYQFGNQGSQPGDYQDYGTVGAPSTMDGSFAVASYNNDKFSFYELKYNGKGFFSNGTPEENPVDFSKGFKYETEYEYVDCGFGFGLNDEKDQGNDFEGINLTGKIALVQRGDSSFSEKIRNAQDAGAVAVIVGNNDPDPDANFGMLVDKNLVPAFAVSRRTYEKLKNAEDKKISIDDKKVSDSPTAGYMSDSSSWGPTPNLGIKPEITAPGNNIYSTDNDGGYTLMSGTSMATPHVTGGISAVRGAVAKANLNFTGKELSAFVKNVLMTTARPINIKGTTDKYYPVRSQGAGLMDLDAATNPNFVTVTDPTSHEAKIEYRQINKTELDINLNLKNYSKKAVDYNVYYVLFTDLPDENGNLNLNTNRYMPRNIQAKTKLGEISLAANGIGNFKETVTWDDSTFAKFYTNGYFVDGFVFFEPKANAEGTREFANLSVPLLAYKGEWDKIEIIEPYIHELLKYDVKPFWHPEDKEEVYKLSNDKINATTLISSAGNDVEQWAGDFILGRATNGEFTDNLAFSPGNPDKNQDYVQFKGVFLRNWADFNIRIEDENGKLVKRISNTYRTSGRKNADTVDGENTYFTTDDVWSWDGKDASGNLVPEGTYKFIVSTRMADKADAQIQEKSVDLKLDNTAPVINSVNLVEKTTVEVTATDDFAGIKAIYYVDSLGAAELTEKDGKYTYTLISDKDIDNGKIIAIDWAGNRTDQLVKEESGKGKVNIEWKAEDGSQQPTNKVNVYRLVEGEDGKEKQIPVSDLTKLQVGKYKVAFDTIPADYEYKIDPEVFEITDDNSEQTVTISYKKVDTKDFGELKIDLVYPGDYDGRVDLFAVDEKGNEYPISNRLAGFGTYLTARVPAGEYSIIARDQNGNPVQLMGPRKIEVKEQDTTIASYQVFYNGESFGLRVYILTDDKELFEKFGESMEENKYIDKDGKEQVEYLFNAKDWFNIINAKTGTSVYDEEIDYENGYSWDKSIVGFYKEVETGVYEIDMLLNLPAGEFEVYFKDDARIYDINPLPLVAESFGADWNKITISRKSTAKGSLTVTEELLAGVKDQPINSVYTLYNSYGELVKATSDMYWADLPVGSYTLVVESKILELVPERQAYDISITDDNLNVIETVRYKNIDEDPVDRKASVSIGAYGSYPDYLENLEVVLTSKKNGKVYRERVQLSTNKTSGKEKQILVPMGIYDVEFTNIPEGTEIESLFLSTFDWVDKSDLLNKDGNKFELLVNQSNVGIEISLRMVYFTPEEPEKPTEPEKPVDPKPIDPEKPVEPYYPPYSPILDWIWSGPSIIEPSKPAVTHKTVSYEVRLTIGSKDYEVIIGDVVTKGKMDVEPYIKEGRTMLPIRYVAEALGFDVEWDNPNRTVILTDKEYKIEIPVDTNKIIVNGKTYESDVKPEIVNDRTMLPIANIARALGLVDGEDIIWNNESKEVIIKRQVKF